MDGLRTFINTHDWIFFRFRIGTDRQKLGLLELLKNKTNKENYMTLRYSKQPPGYFSLRWTQILQIRFLAQ